MPHLDYALGENSALWLRHPVLGDPSFDTFARHPHNPICRGAPPHEWPVNGFLFRDPKSNHWFCYVGFYPKDYAMGEGLTTLCRIYRSEDRGENWKCLGPIFDDKPFIFSGCQHPVIHWPDVSVTFDGVRYHMAYDWASSGAGWANMHDQNSGVGYAWSESPEGPFHRHPEPIFFNDRFGQSPLLGKYRRLYASTLLRRNKDWLLLSIMDSGTYHSWGLAAFTASSPEGPYTEPAPLFHTEGDRYHPALLEYFPAYLHEGYVYAPATTVALNRDYNIVHRAELERAHDPAAWEIFQDGSVWHSEYQEHEAYGMWGQTYSGFVDDNRLHVMAPSRDSHGMGTIHIASRPWDAPLRERGFQMMAPSCDSITRVRRSYGEFSLKAAVSFQGTLRILWGMQSPVGRNAPTANSHAHSLCDGACYALELSDGAWKVLNLYAEPENGVCAAGHLAKKTEALSLSHDRQATVSVMVDGAAIWSGKLPLRSGGVGIRVMKSGWAECTSFDVEGHASRSDVVLLYTEALAGAGQHLEHWEESSSPVFRFGTGAVSRAAPARVKWNFRGTGFRLWLPRGPRFGAVKIKLDGALVDEIDLFSKEEEFSAPVSCCVDLPDGPHAVVVTSDSTVLPVDTLDVLSDGPPSSA